MGRGGSVPQVQNSPVLPLPQWGKRLTETVRTLLILCEMQSCESHALLSWKLPSWVMALAKGSADKEGGITWSYLVQKWDSNSRAADLGYRVNLSAYSWSDGADASHCTHFLSCCFLFWILWFLATSSSWYMAVGSGIVFTCKSCNCNKSKEKRLSKSAERFWHYFMKRKPWKVSTSKRILLHIFSLNVYYQAQSLKTKVKTKLRGRIL